MSKAKVYDFTLGQLKRNVERGAPVEGPEPGAIAADMADGIEAVHQLLNLAGFSERPRAFVLALATAAFRQDSEHVELYDEELAEIQGGCSTKTVQRQRGDYRRESKARHFAPVEIIDGEFNHATGKNDPTLYRFHLAGAVEQTVSAARSAEGWAEMSRRAQRDEIRRAADAAYDLIPDAVLRRRKQRRPRPASAEIDTCRKVIETKLARLKDRASKLSPRERERLMSADEPGELVKWWLELRSDMDAFLKLNSPQDVEPAEVNEGGGQIVHPPSEEEAPEPGPEETAAWEKLEAQLTEPRVRGVEVDVYGPDGHAGADAPRRAREGLPRSGRAGGTADTPTPERVRQQAADESAAEVGHESGGDGSERAGPGRR